MFFIFTTCVSTTRPTVHSESTPKSHICNRDGHGVSQHNPTRGLTRHVSISETECTQRAALSSGRLENYRSLCGVDDDDDDASSRRQGNGCPATSSAKLCRSAVMALMGSELTSNCTCVAAAVAQRSRCLQLHRQLHQHRACIGKRHSSSSSSSSSETFLEWPNQLKQEAFEKCWAHSPLRAAARRIAFHQVSLLSHAACASMSTTTTTTTTTTTRDRGDRYGPMEWAQLLQGPLCQLYLVRHPSGQSHRRACPRAPAACLITARDLDL